MPNSKLCIWEGSNVHNRVLRVRKWGVGQRIKLLSWPGAEILRVNACPVPEMIILGMRCHVTYNIARSLVSCAVRSK